MKRWMEQRKIGASIYPPALLASLLIALVPLQSFGSLLDLGPLDLTETFAGDYASGGARDRGEIYVVPNEVEPEQMRPILEKSPPGVHISVGAERGFIGAALNPGATHLLLIDLVPDVVLFNRINTALLAASDNLKDYMALRTSSSHEVWLKKSNLPTLDEIDRSILRNVAFFNSFSRMQGAATERLFTDGYFKDSNYLREPTMFEKIRQMARDGRIQVHKGNFQDTDMLRRVADEISRKGIGISVVDISNAWERRYVGRRGVLRIMRALSEATSDKAILLTSEMKTELGFNKYLWEYVGFRVEALKKLSWIIRSDTVLTSAVYAQRFFGNGSVVEVKDLTEDALNVIRMIERSGAGFPENVQISKPASSAPRCSALFTL